MLIYVFKEIKAKDIMLDIFNHSGGYIRSLKINLFLFFHTFSLVFLMPWFLNKKILEN